MKKNIARIWIKIDEKFAHMKEAFRSFDRKSNNKISKPDFAVSLEKTLKVMIPSDELAQVFNFLDHDADGYISYQEFCNLSEER